MNCEGGHNSIHRIWQEVVRLHTLADRVLFTDAENTGRGAMTTFDGTH